jgi:hypothetical protein
MLLINLIPEFTDIGPFILINLAHWTYMDLSSNYVIFGTFYVIIMLVLLNVVKGVRYRTLVFSVVLTKGFMKISEFNLLLYRYVDFKYQYLF